MKVGCTGVLGVIILVGIVMSAVASCQPDAPPKTAAELEAERLATPWAALELEEVDASRRGFGNVLMLSGKLRNDADYSIKDPVIRCTLRGESGSEIGRAETTLYQVVPPKSDKQFKEFNMGIAPLSQAKQVNCAVIFATRADPEG